MQNCSAGIPIIQPELSRPEDWFLSDLCIQTWQVQLSNMFDDKLGASLMAA